MGVQSLEEQPKISCCGGSTVFLIEKTSNILPWKIFWYGEAKNKPKITPQDKKKATWKSNCPEDLGGFWKGGGGKSL